MSNVDPTPVGAAQDRDADWQAYSENGTDTDTISSFEQSMYDPPEGYAEEDSNGMAQEIFWQHQRAKSRWKSFMNKPTRRARRFIRRNGKGKYRGKRPEKEIGDTQRQRQRFFAALLDRIRT